jgi:hypothetical protein
MSTPSPETQSNAILPDWAKGLLPSAVSGCLPVIFAAILTLFASLFGSLVTVWVYWPQIQEIQRRLETQQNSDWEEASVYTLVADAGHSGKTIDALFKDYSSDANYAIEHKMVTEKVLGKDEFRRVLMKLTSMRVIIPVGTTKYRILAESDLCGCGYPAAEIINQLTTKAMTYLTNHNGDLDMSEVIQNFQTDENFETESGKHIGPGEAQLLFIHLFQNRMIGVEIKTDGSLGKVWNIGARPDKARSCFTGNWPILGPGPALRPKPTPDERFIPRDPLPRPNERFTPKPSPIMAPSQRGS